MPYTKKNWQRNEIITEDGLNHIETGIEANDTAIKKALQRDIVEANIQKVGPTETSRAEIVQKENGSSLNLIISKDVDENIIQTEEGRVRAEEKRVEAEQSRVLAEAERKKAEAARVLSENKRQQDTSAVIAKTEEATQAAVAKAQTATDNATTAANKAEAAVSKLPLPLGNTLKGEVESTMVSVNDAWPSPVLKAKVLGQSNQVTTTGKNIMHLINSGTANGVNLTANGDGSYHVKGTQTAGFTRFYTDDGIKKPLAEFGLKVGDTVYLSAAEANSKLYLAMFFFDEKGSGVYTQVATNANVTKYTIAENVTQAYVCISLDGSVGTSVDSDFHPMISLNSNKDWEPYTGGKPSPSPEYPQEITNLNKAELVITGRNICPDAELLGGVAYNSGIPMSKYAVQAKFPYAQQSETHGIGAVLNTTKGVTYSIAYLGKANTAAVGIAEYKSVDDVGDISKVVSYARVGSSKKISLTASIDGVMVFILASQWTDGKTNLNTFNKEDMIISVGEPCGTYTPHQSTVTPIDLKGNELCSLPNGVKDEVVIDAEGNVSLIKRVGSCVIDKSWDWNKGETQNGSSRFVAYVHNQGVNYCVNTDIKCRSKIGICSPTDTWMEKDGCAVQGFNESTNCIFMYIKSLANETVDTFKQWITDNPFSVMYLLAESQIIPLGKVELPALPEATSNVWNDGNIPANVYVQYLKDVNIAYGKLESQLSQITMALSMMDTPTVIPEISEDEPTLIPELEESPIEESSI